MEFYQLLKVCFITVTKLKLSAPNSTISQGGVALISPGKPLKGKVHALNLKNVSGWGFFILE